MKLGITKSDKHNYLWFRNAKCATRSVLAYLYKHTDVDLDDYRVKYKPKLWAQHFKFTIVRNPWARLVSCYQDKVIRQKPDYLQARNGKRGISLRWQLNHVKPSFKEFIKIITKDENIHKDDHWDTYHNRVVFEDVDFIGRIENMQEDFNTICDEIGIPQLELEHRNKTQHDYYVDYYDDESKALVDKAFQEDIAYLGYKFGE
jgi:chondroitin 4-sulfotransferase 11